jgi:ATP-binding cassette subfamily F protein 3
VLAQLTDITFGYAGEDLFDGLTWQINAGDHIGLVGPNGAGKSTLLRLLAGEIEPQSGSVARVRGISLGYLHQSQEFRGGGTILSALERPFADVIALRDELERLHDELERSHDDSLIERYGHLEEQVRQKGGYALEARIRELAHDVGFADEDLSRSVETLSGGERNRLELAKVLLAAPDLLLLDEPTNHLDMAACERLEQILSTYPGAFVLVSHDRTFLDSVCKEIVEVDDGRLERYGGGWSQYVAQRDKRRELALAAFERQQAEIARQEEFIRRNIAGQKTNQAKSRRKMLEKLERLQWHRDVWQQAGRIGLRFEIGDRPGGKETLSAEGLSVGYDAAEPLCRELSLTVYRGDRVGIVGPNGAGKTTLLRTLLGREKPLAGTCRQGHDVKLAYFDQKLGVAGGEGGPRRALLDGGAATARSRPDDDEGRSLVDEIRSVRGDLSPDAVRSYLAKFRFFGDDVFRVVKGLSGGERNRLSLAKMMLRPANLLALDEPTNHLDIPAREVLERALRAYEGTLLVVSHDRFFLDQVCTRLLVLHGDGHVEQETGNYSDWRHRRAAAGPAPAPKPAPGSTPAPAPSSDGRASYEREKAKKAERAKLERRFAQLEAEIGELEAKLADVRARLAGDHGGDWQKLHTLVEEERVTNARLQSKLGEWEKIGSELSSSDA